MQILDDCYYTKSHEWVRKAQDGTVTIGITDYAQDLLSDVVFVDLPEVGEKVEAGDEVAVAESVKAAADIYAPIRGEILAVNEALGDSPEKLNEDPYGEGWIYRLQPDDLGELETLLDADAYRELCASEG